MADGDNDGARMSASAANAALDATQGLPVTPAGGVAAATSTPGGAAATQGFLSGDLVAERYRIARLIGEGGMGEVYEAEDLLLRERVALKTVRHEVAAVDPKVIERFKREIQLARKVTHPNVCRIFDVGLHRPANGGRGELAFLTMELLDGETLAARLARAGRMSPAEAAPIVAQMAAALDAAHQENIVHRDFKSANVMLVEGNRGVRAVVTDFGLARGRQAASDPTITGDGGVVGSPSYMAPEQVEGKEVTAAADLYALGVVMYEMITGRLPFVGDTPLSTAVKRLREDPLTPCAHVSGLDPRWERIILWCLRRDPAQRPRSAREVAEAVATSAPRKADRRARLIAAAVAAVALLALVWFASSRRGEPAPGSAASAASSAPADTSGRRAVAVMGFKNLTGRPESDWIAGALAEMVSTELSAGADMRVISGESVARAKRELALGDEVSFAPDTLGRLRKVLDADYILTGSYMALGRDSGGRLRLDLKLVDTRTGETTAVLTQSGAEADLAELVARTGETLRSRLSLAALTPSEKQAARALQPRGDVARLYSEGLSQMRVAACSAARAPLEQAVATDPSFPLARSALADALFCLGHEDRALAEAKKAVELAANLPDHIRLETEARLFMLSKQPDKALDAYEKLFARFPDNFDYGYQLASLQLGLGREEDFPRTVAALRRLPPPAGDNPRIDVLEAYPDIRAGRLTDGLAKVQKARARAENAGMRVMAADADRTLAHIYIALKQPDQALAAAERARATYETANDLDGVAKTLAIEAAVREGQGDREGALRAEKQVQDIAKNLENPRQMWQFKVMLGVRMAAAGRMDTAQTALDDALEIARGVNDQVLVVNTTLIASMTNLLRGELGTAETRLSALSLDGMTAELRTQVLAQLASIYALKDDAAAASAKLAEAEAAASKGVRAQVELVRAIILNDEQKWDDAEKLARAVIKQSEALAPSARFQLVEALLGKKRYAEAHQVLAEIEKAQYQGEWGGELRLAVLRARTHAADGALAEARRELHDVAQRADLEGAHIVAVDARRYLGELELERGDAKQGRVLLASVSRDAAAMGFARMARQVRERLQ